MFLIVPVPKAIEAQTFQKVPNFSERTAMKEFLAFFDFPLLAVFEEDFLYFRRLLRVNPLLSEYDLAQIYPRLNKHRLLITI